MIGERDEEMAGRLMMGVGEVLFLNVYIQPKAYFKVGENYINDIYS